MTDDFDGVRELPVMEFLKVANLLQYPQVMPHIMRWLGCSYPSDIANHDIDDNDYIDYCGVAINDDYNMALMKNAQVVANSHTKFGDLLLKIQARDVHRVWLISGDNKVLLLYTTM